MVCKSRMSWFYISFLCKGGPQFVQGSACVHLLYMSSACLTEKWSPVWHKVWSPVWHPRPKLSVASVHWTYTDSMSVHWGTLMAHCHTLQCIHSVHWQCTASVYTGHTELGSGIIDHLQRCATWYGGPAQTIAGGLNRSYEMEMHVGSGLGVDQCWS